MTSDLELSVSLVQTKRRDVFAPGSSEVITGLVHRFSSATEGSGPIVDDTPVVWIAKDELLPLLRHLKVGLEYGYAMLYDLTVIDERARRQPAEGSTRGDFTVVYHLLSLTRNDDIRIKVSLEENRLSLPSATRIWPAANWYEREAWDMFGVEFEGHPNLRRIIMPPTWRGHPLRKDHHARATEVEPEAIPHAALEQEQEALQFSPEQWGMARQHEGEQLLFLNVGPQHPGTHGVLRLVLQLDGERIVDMVPDIGFHHRGAEKMAERQTWHTYIPYTDRVDYLGGVMNNLPYVLSVEALAGIQAPPRAQVIRVMLCELFRISSHLVWYGTFVQDTGALSPVFYMFTDREHVLDIIEAICGGRLHPNWFRIGGVAQDLPRGWHDLVRDFLAYMPKRLDEYQKMVMRNRIFKARTQGVGTYSRSEAIEWGVTGPGLRACGYPWDFRKERPYSGYEHFDFEIPTAESGDCYARAEVRVEEMRQSLRIIGQCLEHMPSGPYKADHPAATPPERSGTMHDIETLITHFLGVSYGPVIPMGEAAVPVEATKGANSYYAVSDGGTAPYRVRIRSPSFPHMQILPLMTREHMLADLLAILGSVDFVLADVDR